ncbi:hypothetical protein EV130_101423 [Rhizobium azibense]|uniref:Uncharacterized protein n=1 Tax=Rhizobium azibense TaxID=1136135 RepID=A0A4R3R6Q5_9HYPH|nr:hypothetical protein EV130_101423 [Rhizobium azibense]
MLRQTYDPKVTQELAVMRIVFPLVGLVICISALLLASGNP